MAGPKGSTLECAIRVAVMQRAALLQAEVVQQVQRNLGPMRTPADDNRLNHNNLLAILRSNYDFVGPIDDCSGFRCKKRQMEKHCKHACFVKYEDGFCIVFGLGQHTCSPGSRITVFLEHFLF